MNHAHITSRFHYNTTGSNALVELEAGEDVVVDGVGEVVEQVLEGADAGDEPLDEVPEDGEHGEPAVLDLLELELLHLLLGLSEPERVEERAAGVGRVAGAGEELLEAEEVLLAHGARVVPVLEAAVLGEAHERHVEDEERVGVGPVVVGARRRDDPRLEPRQRRLRRDEAQLAEDLRSDGARSAQHGEAPVDHLPVGQPLGLDEAAGALRVGEAQRVETVVAGQPATTTASSKIGSVYSNCKNIHGGMELAVRTCHRGRRGIAWTRTTAACQRLAARKKIHP
uniref:Uncharacterized protein n=1 Tax=Setaria italica TaxID=4555 RepID=K3XYP1_SETIT